MRKVLFLLLMLISTALFSQTKSEIKPDDNLIKRVVKAACGKCRFKMNEVKGCCLAVEIDGKKYVVEGSSMKDHGNPRGKHGMCRQIREAEVSGKIENNKFLAYDFKLLPMDNTELPLKEIQDSPPIENKM